jgi:hypothetical protein
MRRNLRAHHTRPKNRRFTYDKVAQDDLLKKRVCFGGAIGRKVPQKSNERLKYRKRAPNIKTKKRPDMRGVLEKCL